MNTQGSIEIDRPIEDVFRLTNDHVAEWSLVVVEDTVINETPDRVGTTFRSVTEDRGKRMEFQGEVTRWEAPTLSAIHMTGDMFDLDVEYSFEDLGERTRVYQTSDVTPKGMIKIFFLLFGWLMKKSSCKALDNELESLKKFCESQS